MTNTAKKERLLLTGLSNSYISAAHAMWKATPMSKDANPNQNNGSCSKILAA
jgi:hypothetical protein